MKTNGRGGKSSPPTAGNRPPTLTLNQARDLALALNSVLTQRRDLAARAGYQFGTDRDLYKVLGYKRTLEFADYLAVYERQDIAGRIVEAPARDTWRELPSILDGDMDGGSDETPFARAWQELARRLRVAHFLTRADILSRVGRYGVLLIGVKGDGKLDEPVKPGGVTDPAGVIFLQPYGEGSATIKTWVTDAADPRFGLPASYEIDLGSSTGQSGKAAEKREVHWSRVIHLAEGLLEDNVYGTPALRGVFNRLMDLEKTVGGAAEAFWRLAYKGLVASTKEGYQLPSDADGESELEDQVEEFVHDLRRFLLLDGMEVQELGGQSVDPKPTMDSILDLIAGDTEIPKRILLGSELGELASSQDAANWAGRVHNRRTNYAEPMVLFPLIDRLILFGVLPPPAKGSYAAKWKPLFELNEIELADIAVKYANAFHAVTAGAPETVVTPEEFREHFTPLPAEMDTSAILEFLREEREAAALQPEPDEEDDDDDNPVAEPAETA